MKSINGFISCLIVLLLNNLHLCAQHTPGSTSNGIIPKVIPLSPEASSLGKYGDWQVSYYTGLPSISIPLYEVKQPGGDHNMPISLSYHGGGVKVD